MKRMTRQYEAIFRCLAERGHPLSIEEILSLVSKEIPTINVSTIYRNLKTLIQEGKIALVDLPKEKPRYEVVKEENSHHHYFLCDKCNKTFNIHGCPPGLQNILPTGFMLLGHSITLNGYCIECN